jgi:hypothetical protein
MEDFNEDGPRKRRRLSDDGQIESSTTVRTLERPVSPPPLRRPLKTRKDIPSPFQLTRIHDLPESSNLSTVSLRDILGDPMIAECWEFNYLHDLDFLMDAFDPDVRDLVKVNVVHGFWKSENPSRHRLKVRYYSVRLNDTTLFSSLSSFACLFSAQLLIRLRLVTSREIRECETPHCLHARDVWYASL